MNLLTTCSPVGKLLLSENDGRICGLAFLGAQTPPPNRESRLLLEAEMQLNEYFAGKRTSFDLPLQLDGTPFALSVWNELLRIPYGETRSYSEISAAIGNKNAARAVGTACHNNPISVIVPCHRVIGAEGNLVGFGGGVSIKERLLRLEGSIF